MKSSSPSRKKKSRSVAIPKNRKKPRQSRSKFTVEILVEATTAILKKHGYEGLTTNKVAERAGVSIGTLYQYFANKESLVAAVIDKHSADIANIARAEFADAKMKPLKEAIPQMVAMTVKVHGIDPKLHRILDEQVPKLGRYDKLLKVREEFTRYLADDYVRRSEEVRIKDSQIAAYMVVQLSEAIVHQAVNYYPQYIKGGRLVEELSDLLGRYLLREEKTEPNYKK